MAFSAPIHTNEHSVDRVLKAGLPVVLVFWRSDNCVPCAELAPVLDRLAREHSGRLLVAKVDVVDNPALARRYEVAQLPSLIVVQNGQVVGRAAGAAEQAGLDAWLRSVLEGRARPAPNGPSVPLSGTSPSRETARPATAGAPGATSTRTPAEQATGSAKPLVLTDRTFAQVIGQSDMPVLVDFWAPWCGPCRMVAPTVEQLAREFDGRARVAKINVDENPRTSQSFNIRGIPALLIFRNGQIVERFVGVQPITVLRAALAKHAATS
jgi:thioredoxin 1